MVLQHLKYQNKLSFTMLLVCISLLTACGSTKVNSNNTSEAHSGVDTENNVYSTKETEVATENEQDNTELGETFYTLGRRENPKILFAYDYSVNWKYIDIGEGTEYRQEKIEDRKGAEIIFWHYAEQFSQYYGGVYEECSWNYYGGTYAVVAEAEGGKFTESEENDVIKFLSTFRQEYE